MLERTGDGAGKNDFKDNIFSAYEWSAVSMVSPTEIKNLVESFKLEGRIIKQLRIIGLAYNLRRDSIENTAYNYLEELSDPDADANSDYFNINAKLPYYRFAEIDQPFMIEFEDGDVFEINTPQVPEFRMSMNCIPWWIESGINSPNVDANVLFAPCIGRAIRSVEVKTFETETDPISQLPFDDFGAKREFVSSIIIRLDDGCSLCIKGRVDFCIIDYLNQQDKPGVLTFEKLKQALFN